MGMKLPFFLLAGNYKNKTSIFREQFYHYLHNPPSSTMPLEKAMAPTPVLLPGKSHGWRSLEGCSPWGCWGSDMTERLHFHFSLSCTGEGNGNPLQCSCLENPRDGGAWWAAVYGVLQSRTRLKWRSSRSSTMPHLQKAFIDCWVSFKSSALTANQLYTLRLVTTISSFSHLCEYIWLYLLWNLFWMNRWEYQITWPASWEICMQVKKQQLELDMEQQTGSK